MCMCMWVLIHDDIGTWAILEAMQQKHESHATEMKHRHGAPISRLSGLWTDSGTCTPIFLSGTSEPLAEQHWGYPCRTGKSRPCAWPNMMSAEGQTCSLGCTNILQNASTCISHQHASKWWNWAGRYKSTFLIIPQFLDVPWQFVFFFQCSQPNRCPNSERSCSVNCWTPFGTSARWSACPQRCVR